jgi:Glycosyltransferase WbsX
MRRPHHHHHHHRGSSLCYFQFAIVIYVVAVGWLLGGPVVRKHLVGISATTVSDLQRPLVIMMDERKLETVSSSAIYSYRTDKKNTFPNDVEPDLLPRVLAFVFPQFHRDPLNDRLWGDGFTDWDNLRKAPTHNRRGFAIPRPTELGYYNYTDSEPRRKQGELATAYGLDGFIFHHYWFYDTKHPGPSLAAPLEAMLKDGYPDVPFALHWCAIKWVNTWSGAVRPDFVYDEPNVLQKQFFPTNYTDDAITQHYQWLRQFFHHPNYIKVGDGKPLFMLYQKKPSSFPVLKRLSELAKADGFPGLYLTVGLNMPHSHLLPVSNPNQYDPPPQKFRSMAMKHFVRPVAYPNPAGWNEHRSLQIPDWCLTQAHPQDKQQAPPPRVPDIAGIISSFDNTPRRNHDEAVLWSAQEPKAVVEQFQKSLVAGLYYETCCFDSYDDDKSRRFPRDRDDRFLVLNAMNEWAEGMALEPSDVFGRSFLEAIRDAKTIVRQSECEAKGLPPEYRNGNAVNINTTAENVPS